jgi:hypothetical protein
MPPTVSIWHRFKFGMVSSAGAGDLFVLAFALIQAKATSAQSSGQAYTHWDDIYVIDFG